MRKKTYYDVLGVSKHASEAQIKQAFRKLVRKYHPDVSDDPNADDKIAEINNAYETLSDAKKRRRYDAMQANPFTNLGGTQSGGGFGNFATGKGTSGKSGFDWQNLKTQFAERSGFAEGFKFEDILSAFGRAESPKSNTHAQQGKAKTSDQSTKNSKQPHNPFEQFGFAVPPANKGEDQQVDIQVELASVYTGDRYNITLNVPTRQPDGSVKQQQKKVLCQVPKGLIEGQKIRLVGQGAASLAGGDNGDLLLTLKLTHADNIRLDGADVYQTINITPWEAALQQKITVDTPAGVFEVNIPADSQSGSSLRLQGKGIPASPAGDLYLVLHIINPTLTTDAQREAFVTLQDAFKNVEITR